MAHGSDLSRRERILVAAEAEFAATGFSGARVDRIAAAAAVNKQLLFHYFRSKAGLHKAVAEAVAHRLAVVAPPGGTPAERLRTLVDQLVRAAHGFETLLSAEWRSGAVSTMKAIIEDGQRSGYFRDDADPDAVAEVVISAAFGRHRASSGAQGADADSGRFVGSLTGMIVDHCSWR
jgi:AcrR family transcriptional regulator